MVIGSVGNITTVAFCIRALFFHQYKMYVIQLNCNMEKEEMTSFFFFYKATVFLDENIEPLRSIKCGQRYFERTN